jgi:hypothetical protein
MDLYNSVLDDVLSGHIGNWDTENQTIMFHQKMRLNRIADLKLVRQQSLITAMRGR